MKLFDDQLEVVVLNGCLDKCPNFRAEVALEADKRRANIAIENSTFLFEEFSDLRGFALQLLEQVGIGLRNTDGHRLLHIN